MKKKESLLVLFIAMILVIALPFTVNAAEDDFETAEGREFSYAANVKHFFTLLGNEFFTSCGKQSFTLYGKEIFTSPGKEFFTFLSGGRRSRPVHCQLNISGCLSR